MLDPVSDHYCKEINQSSVAGTEEHSAHEPKKVVYTFASAVGTGNIASASACLSADFRACMGMTPLDNQAFELYLEALCQPFVDQEPQWQFWEQPTLKHHQAGFFVPLRLSLSCEKGCLAQTRISIAWLLYLTCSSHGWRISAICTERN